MHTHRAMLGAIFGVFLLLLALKNSEIAANGIKKGLGLVGNVLLPSLLPFLVLSELLPHLGVGEFAARYVGAPLRPFLGLSDKGATALLTGFLAGMPVGAASANTLLRRGEITKGEHERILLLANTPSTGFLVGAVGTLLFGNKEAGVALFLFTLAAALLVGVLLRLICGCVGAADGLAAREQKSVGFATALTDAVKRASGSFLNVAAFVLFFSALTECILAITEAIGLPQLVSVLLCGITELTAGTAEAVRTLAPGEAFLLTAFFAGFSGLSVMMQVFSIVGRDAPRALPYLLAKLLQGLFCLLFAALYLVIKKPQLSPSTESFAALGRQVLLLTPALSLLLPLLLFLALLLLAALYRMKLVTFYKPEK